MFEASKGRLKVVGRAGVGVDNVDLAAATEVSSLYCLDHTAVSLLPDMQACYQLSVLRLHCSHSITWS